MDTNGIKGPGSLRQGTSSKPQFLCNAGEIQTNRFGDAVIKFNLDAIADINNYLRIDLTDDNIKNFVALVIQGIEHDNVVSKNLIKCQYAAATGYIYTTYCLPHIPLEDSYITACAHFITAIVLHDDIMELGPHNEANPQKFITEARKFNSLVTRVVQGEKVPRDYLVTEKYEFQEQDLILHLYKTYVALASKALPDYDKKCKNLVEEHGMFLDNIDLYFRIDAGVGVIGENLDQLLENHATFEFLRRYDISSGMFVEVLSLPVSSQLTEEIRQLPEYKRMFEGVNLAMGYLNDLFSCIKEFDVTEYQQQGQNKFRSARNGVIRELLYHPEISITEAVNRITEKTNEEVAEGNYCGELLVKRFPESKTVAKFVEHVRHFYDGGIVSHIACKHRYKCSGISRVEGSSEVSFCRSLGTYAPNGLEKLRAKGVI